MLWGLLASALLHVLVVVTLPGFKVSLEDQKDFLTVQLDSASKPDPELIECFVSRALMPLRVME